MLAMMLFGCGKTEQEAKLSSEEQELQELEEKIEGWLEERAENEAAAATAEAEDAESGEWDNSDMADRVTAYFMGEELLDNNYADNMKEPIINRIRESGKQVKFMKYLCVYEDAWFSKVNLFTDTLEDGMYGVSSTMINDDIGGDLYFMTVVTCGDDASYDDFKAKWEFFADQEMTRSEGDYTEDVVVDDGTLVLDGLEEDNIYNFDGNYYVLRSKFETVNSEKNNGMVTDYAGLKMVLIKGDKTQLDFNKFKIETTYEPAQQILKEMNYEPLGRFPNRDWMCNNGFHPAYDMVIFKGTFERERLEAAYAVLVDHMAETGYEGGHDFIVSYTNDAGEEIDVRFYGQPK